MFDGKDQPLPFLETFLGPERKFIRSNSEGPLATRPSLSSHSLPRTMVNLPSLVECASHVNMLSVSNAYQVSTRQIQNGSESTPFIDAMLVALRRMARDFDRPLRISTGRWFPGAKLTRPFANEQAEYTSNMSCLERAQSSDLERNGKKSTPFIWPRLSQAQRTTRGQWSLKRVAR